MTNTAQFKELVKFHTKKIIAKSINKKSIIAIIPNNKKFHANNQNQIFHNKNQISRNQRKSEQQSACIINEKTTLQ